MMWVQPGYKQYIIQLLVKTSD